MNKMKGIVIALACLVFPSFCFSQNSQVTRNNSATRPADVKSDAGKEEINWLTFEQAVEKNKIDPKKMFIDVYTNWCGWCKRMDATTFKDPAVVDYMNKNFHAVKLNAETKDTIRFQDQQFVYRAENRANDIAVSLLNKRMSYPTTVYLDETVSILSPVPGYLTAAQIMPVLKYYGENIYKTKSWEDYSKEIQPASPGAPQTK